MTKKKKSCWHFLEILALSLLLLHETDAQVTIQYGSNKGRYASINNTKIYYEEYGKGPVLMLLHGGLGSISDFEKIIPELSRHYRVIAADRPGHGRSEQADSLSYDLMASYTSKMIDLLKLDSVYLLGWSDGGNTALLLAESRSDKIKKTIVSGANYSIDGMTKEALAMIPNLTPETVEAQMKDWLVDYQKKSPQKDNWKKFINDSRKMWLTKIIIPEDRLKQIKSPVLVVLGDHDMATLEHGIQMHRLIKGSQFCVLPATTHFGFKERPDLMTQLTLNFLNSK